jgi:hypothetical protein
MKVKFSPVFWKVLSRKLFWPIMKTIHQELRKLLSMLKFAGGNGNWNAAMTVSISLFFLLFENNPAKNNIYIYIVYLLVNYVVRTTLLSHSHHIVTCVYDLIISCERPIISYTRVRNFISRSHQIDSRVHDFIILYTRLNYLVSMT